MTDRTQDTLKRAIKTKAQLTRVIKKLSATQITCAQILLRTNGMKAAVDFVEDCLKRKEGKQ